MKINLDENLESTDANLDNIAVVYEIHENCTSSDSDENKDKRPMNVSRPCTYINEYSADAIEDMNEPLQFAAQVKDDSDNSTIDPYDQALNILYSSCKYTWWPSIQIFRKLLLVSIFIFTDYVMLRLFAMGLVLLIYLVLLLLKHPYVDTVMNRLEVTLTTLLIFLDVICVIDSVQIYDIPQTYDMNQLLGILHVLRVIILILPFPMLFMYIVIDKYQSNDDSLKYMKKD